MKMWKESGLPFVAQLIIVKELTKVSSLFFCKLNQINKKNLLTNKNKYIIIKISKEKGENKND